MKKSILNLEGVAVLTKIQQKNTFGGLADGGFGGGDEGACCDCTKTGVEKDLTSYDTATGTYVVVSHVCEWKCNKKFLGITVGSSTHFAGCGLWG